MVTKICVGDYVGDIYHHAKFYPNRFRGFVSAHAWFRVPLRKVTRLFFFGGGGFLSKATAETRAPLLTKVWPTFKRRGSAQGSAMGVAKQDPHFPPKPSFWAPFRRDRIFRPKTALTLDGSRANDP